MSVFAVPPRPTSTTGPKRLTFSGAAVLVLAVAAFVGAVWSVFSTPITGVMDGHGGPGPRVVVALRPGETTTVALDAGQRYQLWLLTNTHLPDPRYPAPTVVGPDGHDVTVTDSASDDFQAGSYHYAYGLWETTTTAAGTYTITMPTDDTLTDVTLAVAPAVDSRQLWGHIGLGFALWFTAPVLGFVGLGLTVAGVIWWAVRKNRSGAPAWPPAPYVPFDVPEVREP